MMTDRYKELQRQSCMTIRRALSLNYQDEASTQVCTRIRQLNEYRHAKRIALYKSMNGEISLGQISRSAPLHSKYCYFPVMNKNKTLSFLPVSPKSTFVINPFGVKEPDVGHEQALAPEQLDMMFIPLVGFDHQGGRLGMGGGYYDRTLAHSRPSLLVGVAYEFQRQTFIDPQPWDIALDLIITDQSYYWTRQRP